MGCARPGGVLQPLPMKRAALLKPGDFDWNEIFASGGIRWFHSGGIFAALSQRLPAELIIEGMKPPPRPLAR